MTKTGDPCPMTGRWKGNDEHGTIARCHQGREMPPCDHCHHAITWTYVGPLS